MTGLKDLFRGGVDRTRMAAMPDRTGRREAAGVTAVTSQTLRAFLLGAVAAASLSTAALAQSPSRPGTASPSQNSVGVVVVTGKRKASDATVRTVIAPFVSLHAARDRKTGMLVRVPPSGVCPIALGLSPAFNAFVTARIFAVAKSVRAPVAKAGECQPNVEIVFTEAPQDLVDRLAKRSGDEILGFHYVGESRALSRVTRPIQAWYMTGTVSAAPAEATRVIDVIALQPRRLADGANPSEAVVDRAYWPDPYSGTGSRMSPRHNSQLVNVLIVADLGKLDGREIGPISDYVAMLALSQVRSLDACNTLPSILDMLAAGCQSRPAPEALTDSDTAFLKALYTSDLSTSGDSGSYRVEHAMAKDIVAGDPSR